MPDSDRIVELHKDNDRVRNMAVRTHGEAEVAKMEELDWVMASEMSQPEMGTAIKAIGSACANWAAFECGKSFLQLSWVPPFKWLDPVRNPGIYDETDTSNSE